jgi:hypothetical protein
MEMHVATVGQMSFEEFRATLAAAQPPENLPSALLGLWQDARNDWDAAHRAVQDDSGSDAAWVHAYLHRKEGDPGNAAYWYRRAGRPVATDPLADEWTQLAQTLCAAAAAKKRST